MLLLVFVAEFNRRLGDVVDDGLECVVLGLARYEVCSRSLAPRRQRRVALSLRELQQRPQPRLALPPEHRQARFPELLLQVLLCLHLSLLPRLR